VNLEELLYGKKNDQIKDYLFLFFILLLCLAIAIFIAWGTWYVMIVIIIISFMSFKIIKESHISRKKIKTLLGEISKKELLIINKEINELIIHVRNHYALTNSYIIDLNQKNIIKYEDVIWIYQIF